MEERALAQASSYLYNFVSTGVIIDSYFKFVVLNNYDHKGGIQLLKKASFTCILFIGLTLLLLTGCNNGDEKTAGSSKGEEDIELTKPGTFPITKEKVTLKVLVPAHPLVEDYKTNVFTKWYEEKTNVHIEWEVIPTQNAAECGGKVEFNFIE